MKSITYGIFFIIFGLGSFILPRIGLQFELFMLFEILMGSFAWIASVIFVGIGILLITHGLTNKNN